MTRRTDTASKGLEEGQRFGSDDLQQNEQTGRAGGSELKLDPPWQAFSWALSATLSAAVSACRVVRTSRSDSLVLQCALQRCVDYYSATPRPST